MYDIPCSIEEGVQRMQKVFERLKKEIEEKMEMLQEIEKAEEKIKMYSRNDFVEDLPDGAVVVFSDGDKGVHVKSNSEIWYLRGVDLQIFKTRMFMASRKLGGGCISKVYVKGKLVFDIDQSEVKEMTVAEIEAKLGHPVKVIKEEE